MLETKQLRYLVAAAECRSFSEAAKRLYTSQSSVSKCIASLEAELGYPLFRRDSQGVELTAEGSELYCKAVAVLRILDSIKS